MARKSKIGVLVLLGTFLAFGNLNAQETVKGAIDKGIVCARAGRHDEAIAEFSKSIELNPTPEAYYNRGYTYYVKGNHDQAILDYSKAIELYPYSAEVYYNRGVVYYAKGNSNQAILDYSKAIELKPDYTVFPS